MQITAPGSSCSEWDFGKPSTGNLGGTLQRLDYTPSAVPLQEELLSRDGWYYLEDSQRLLLSPDFENGWVTARAPNTDQTDGFLFGYGLDYASALHEMTRVSEMCRFRASMRWAHGTRAGGSTLRMTTEQSSRTFTIMTFRSICSSWTWTGIIPTAGRACLGIAMLLPDAEQLLKDLHADQIHVTLNDHPQEGIKPTEDSYSSFMQAMGQDPASQKTLTYDAGDRTYIETLLKTTHTPLEKEGVDFWWLDWMGDNQAPFNTISWMNELYYRHSEEAQPEKDLRGMSFSRWADWGDQRHPIHFSGDMPIGWSGLQFEVPFTATANNVGAFYWSREHRRIH